MCIVCKNCAKFLQNEQKNLHTDFRPREEPVIVGNVAGALSN